MVASNLIASGSMQGHILKRILVCKGSTKPDRILIGNLYIYEATRVCISISNMTLSYAFSSSVSEPF